MLNLLIFGKILLGDDIMKKTSLKTKKYDVAIIGGGVSGLTAAIYALRSGLSTVIIEKGMIGGQVSLTNEIKNYPGFESITGPELSLKMHEQANKLGAKTIYGEVKNIDFKKMDNVIYLDNGEIGASAILLCMGAKARELECKGEKEFVNAGVSYCTICDGAFYSKKSVVIVGGGNTAIQGAIYLSNLCSSVLVSTNLPAFVCEPRILDEFNKVKRENKNIKVQFNTMTTEIYGNKVVKGVKFSNDSDKKTDVKASAVFVAIGRKPDTKFIRNKINLDENGFVAVNENLETNKAGVFAAGDVRANVLRQIVTACADGAKAANNAFRFISANR